MKNYRVVQVLLILILVGIPAAACKSEPHQMKVRPEKVAPSPKPGPVKGDAPTTKKEEPKETFKIVVAPPAILVSGAKGKATVSVTALAGYKWNKEYPAKLRFETAPKYVSLDKTEFKQLAGDFKIGDKKADVSVPMSAKSPGQENVTGEIKFSICNETACIIKKAPVEIAVNVKP
jgi:hypothetical protein